jgi:hypothetical protein
MKSKTYIILGIVSALLSITALADDGGRHGNNNGNNGNNNNNQNARNEGEAFSSAVVGSSPGATIGGVASGGAPWVVSTGSAELSAAGKLEVSVTGLLLGANAPANLVGTVGPVQMVAASLICGGSGGMVAASTGGVLLSASGNASIESTLALPATCAAPIILVRIFNPAAAAGSQLGAFIAESGFNAGANATAADNNDDDHGHHD